MCGIAGYVQPFSSPDRPIERMVARLAHRGPDGQGIWETRHGDWRIVLGHRRLSIIDPALGHQPLGAVGGSSSCITYNGEVYNFRELRAALECRGHAFSTHCDTEVVLHHLLEAGDCGLRDLHGMFALGLWIDAPAGRCRLLLARDRIGIKPLYYAPLPAGGIAFASELTALLEHPAVDRQLDPDGVTSLFFLDYIQPPHTIVRGAKKLEPGHLLDWTATDGTSLPRPFWTLSVQDESAIRDGRVDLTTRLRAALDDAVRSQLVSDVPLGVFLSGGIDSSLVAALAQRHASEPLKTFSIAFEDPEFDESASARAVAAHIGSRHHERILCEATLLQTLGAALGCLDEPVGDPSIVPTFLLSELAAGHVKVALGGDGADELWAGYPTYRAHRLAKHFARLPRGMRRRVVVPLIRGLPVRHRYQSLEWKLKRFVLRWDDRPAMRHLRWMSNTDVPDLLCCLCDFGGWPEGLARLTDDCNGGSTIGLNSVLAMDLASYLPGAVLTKVDRCSMAHGLEVRPPMLDERLVDLAFSLPAEAKLSGSQTKAALKRAAEGILPDRIIHRRKKGFAIPLARWLQGPLREKVADVIEGGSIWSAGMLNRQTFRHWQAEHQSNEADRSKPLWALMVLNDWHDRLARARLN